MLCTFGYTVLFLGIHRQAYYSPLAVRRLQRPLFAPLKSHFIRSMQSHSPDLTKKEMSLRGGKAATGRPTSEVTVRCAERQPCIEVLCVRCGCCRRRSPRLPLLLLYAPASVHTLSAAVLLQCLLRDGGRPPTTGPCKLILTTPSASYYLFQSRQKKTSQSAHISLCLGVLCP